MELRPLSRAAGLERLGISLATLPPGQSSFTYHSHESEEEFIYIIEGSGRLKVDGELIAVGAGDFLGFPTPSVAHQLINDGGEDLVYLLGGERRAVEIAELPELGRKVFRGTRTIDVAPVEALEHPFGRQGTED
jgi:uncharacterized cupin superfamily protein